MSPALPSGAFGRLLRSVAITMAAGLAGLAVHSALMLGKDALDILPGFQPQADFQRLLGDRLGGPLGSIVPYLTGAMIWGFLYARAHPHLPGGSFWVRGLCFALFAWAVMSTGFFLLAGHGLFGLGLGYGLWPAALMLPMLASFSLALSFTHSRMRPG